MKTLDEVIEILDGIDQTCTCCAYQYSCDETDCIEKTALHYLKEYQQTVRWIEIESEQFKQTVDFIKKAAANDPLTWDELKRMEGKPVWVEALLYKQWAIVACVYADYIRFEGANLYAPEHRIYMGEDNGWQAYRKERNEDA